MSIVEVNSSYYSVELENEGQPILPNEPLLMSLVQLTYLYSGIKEMEFSKAAPTVFDFLATRDDGREWHHTLEFDSDNDPFISTDVTPGWKISEIEPLREIRDLIVKLVVKHNMTRYEFKRH